MLPIVLCVIVAASVFGVVVSADADSGDVSLGSKNKTDDVTNLAEALNSIEGDYSLIWGLDAQAQEWLPYSPDVPSYVNRLSVLEIGKGYWMNMMEPGVLSYGDLSYELEKDWNLIGWGASGGEMTPLTEGLASIDGIYTLVWTFDAVCQEWRVYDTAPGAPDDYVMLKSGQGYYLDVKYDCVLTYGINKYPLYSVWNLIGWLG